MDVGLMKLQYEILNVTPQELASLSGLPIRLIEEEINTAGWKQLWPSAPSLTPASAPIEGIDDTDTFVAETDNYIDQTRRRLKVYSLAKEIYLSTKYLELESALIEAAVNLTDLFKNAADGQMVKAQDLKFLSALYKDLTSGSNLSNLANTAIGTDDNGIPTLVIRDLSGSGK